MRVTKAKLRKALRQSIEHWYDNLSAALAGEYDAVHVNSDDCSLCLACGWGIVVGERVLSDCTVCPVGRSLPGRGRCMRTPWMHVAYELRGVLLDGYAPDKLIRAVEKEIHFLESLDGSV